MKKTFSIVKEPIKVALSTNFATASWRYTLAFAIGWYLMPVLVILSRLLKKEIKFGVFK